MTARWPTTLLPTSCKFGRSRNPIFQISQTSFIEATTPRGRPLWSAECEWELQRSEVDAWRRQIAILNGGGASIVIWDFANPFPSLWWYGSGPLYWSNGMSLPSWVNSSVLYSWVTSSIVYESFAGSLAVTGSFSSGGSVVSVSGFPANKLVLRQGDLIEFDERLYIIAEDETSDGSGVAVIDLTTPLLTSLTVLSSVKIMQPGCVMRLTDFNIETTNRWNDGLVQASAKFREVA